MSTDIGNLLGRLGNQDAAGCPAPFIGEALHPFRGGFYGGRNCAENPLAPPGNASRCCIPCPVFDYTYQDDFKSLTDGAAWVNVAGFILCSFLLLSNAVLPAAITRRSYLNIVILIGILILELGFIVPLARQPEQCFDPVTPNGQGSDLTCAFSGAFLAFGLLFYVVWILIRSLFMHVQVCWNRTPDKISYIAANVAAFSITISLTTATLAHTGVSYRFGGYCHINVRSLATYWGWLFGFGGTACVLQIATMIYCIKVYMSSAWNKRNDPSTKSASIVSSSRTQSARAKARRVRQVLLLQWRSITLAFLAVFTTAFVCVVFMIYDNELTIEAFDNVDKLIPWLLCLIETQEKEQCLQLTSPFIISENLAVATLFILSFVGIEAFFLLCRWEIFGAWWSLIRRPQWKRNNSSVSNFMIHQAQQQEQKTPVEEKTPREDATAVDDTNAARGGRDNTAAGV
ncbi:hypothetical protein CKM354_000921400 [Cercospora kikuchii]|uniref:G-protein coupled receptors family 2 profile 2 domain-containing protein n=1 Tax=Cercospora kikuchii TaxID=84275 RepID=A0A9P3CUQ3_9PEZI|nr:uncharacterized protein CKM354_000921400 [Cercospora kikuchii]GIZ46075.1 hypothetical protein CKM354_000921400 [Cercospora kikuchii]